MNRDDLASHATLAAATTVYAVYLESLKRSYHPDKVIHTVVAGVMLTFTGAGLRILLSPNHDAWWGWHQVGYHFVTSGSVIGIWQFYQYIQRELERQEGRDGRAARLGRRRGAADGPR